MKKNIIYILTIICLMFLPDIALAQVGESISQSNRMDATIEMGAIGTNVYTKKTVPVSYKSDVKTTIDINLNSSITGSTVEVVYDLRSSAGVSYLNIINMFPEANRLISVDRITVWDGNSTNMRLFTVRYVLPNKGNYTIRVNLVGRLTAVGSQPVYVTVATTNLGVDPRQINVFPNQTITPQVYPLGDDFTTPVNVIASGDLTSSASYNLIKYTSTSTLLSGGDIIFKLTTTRKLDLYFTASLTRRSNVSIALCNASRALIDKADYSSVFSGAYSKNGLEAGTYYLILDQSNMDGIAGIGFRFSKGNYPEDPTDPVEPSQPVESVGKVITKEVSYKYNVRSWTTEIKNDGFTQNLNYTHSGNIKDMTWKTGSPVKTRKYEYTYDQLSRLLRAKYTGLTNENFSTSYSYDKHGNIMTLGRFGKKDAGTGASSFVRVDSLQMTYSGNQLTRVTDKGVSVAIAESEDFKDYTNGSGQYTYNTNGALTKDTHKGILGISYNSLNLPREIAIKNSSVSGKNYYTYSASGVKLKTVHMGSTNLNYVPVLGSTSGDTNFNEVTTTEYIGNKVYEDNVLKRILVEGGYYDVEKEKYFFYVQDHLGNNRLVADENGTVTQATHYYPFGQGFANNEGQNEQPYKYNGKEQDRRHGLNMYDYSARYYEPAIGRFTTVDPLAEKYYSWSPYSYVLGNPMRNIDPFGMDVWTTNDPEKIARFIDHLQSVAGNMTADPFDYGGWDRMTDDEYKKYNKENSVSFNDDTFKFNINLDDYKGDFKAGMRSKETNYAYITPSDLDGLNELEEAEFSLSDSFAGVGVGSVFWYSFGGGVHKNSVVAKAIWPPSRVVGDAKKTTSLYSLILHRKGYGKMSAKKILSLTGGSTYAGQLSRLVSGLGYLGAGYALYEAVNIGSKLGYWFGGDSKIRTYRQDQYIKRRNQSIIGSSK